MAERMSTATRMDRARANGKISRIENGTLKRKERTKRDAKMVELLKKGKYPYIPSMQTWVSEKLGKPFTQVSEAEAMELAK
jgi:hypothetical protein